MGQTKNGVKTKKPTTKRGGRKAGSPPETPEEAPVEARLAEAIDKAIKDSVAALHSGELSGIKVGELLKLIQIQKELGTEQPKQINVQWVETWESTSSNDE